MVNFNQLIETLTNLTLSSERLLQVVIDDESRAEEWDDLIEALEEQTSYARGVLIHAGRPIREE